MSVVSKPAHGPHLGVLISGPAQTYKCRIWFLQEPECFVCILKFEKGCSNSPRVPFAWPLCCPKQYRTFWQMQELLEAIDEHWRFSGSCSGGLTISWVPPKAPLPSSFLNSHCLPRTSALLLVGALPSLIVTPTLITFSFPLSHHCLLHYVQAPGVLTTVPFPVHRAVLPHMTSAPHPPMQMLAYTFWLPPTPYHRPPLFIQSPPYPLALGEKLTLGNTSSSKKFLKCPHFPPCIFVSLQPPLELPCI